MALNPFRIVSPIGWTSLIREHWRVAVTYLVARSMHQAVEAACEAAWLDFYEAWNPLLRKLVSRHCHGSSGVNDRVQDIWRIVIERIKSYDPERGSFRSWLSTVVRNAMTDQDRAFHALGHLDDELERRLPSRETEPPTACEQAEVRATVALRGGGHSLKNPEDVVSDHARPRGRGKILRGDRGRPGPIRQAGEGSLLSGGEDPSRHPAESKTGAKWRRGDLIDHALHRSNNCADVFGDSRWMHWLAVLCRRRLFQVPQLP